MWPDFRIHDVLAGLEVGKLHKSNTKKQRLFDLIVVLRRGYLHNPSVWLDKLHNTKKKLSKSDLLTSALRYIME